MRARLPAALSPRALPAALALLLVGAAPSPAPCYPPEAFSAALEAMVTQDGAPGVAALVFRDGRLLYRAQAGEIDPQAPLLVASASKWVAAALVMTLVDDGTLALDEPIGRRLPEITGEAADITLRQLLSFTSGQGGLASLADLRQPSDISLAESARRIAALPLENPPGTVFEYGSGALQIAGALAEQATAKSWSTLFEERLAEPLEMRQSYWTHPLHARREPSTVSNPNLQGGLVTTAGDYSRFLSMAASEGKFRGRQILSSVALNEMEHLQTSGVRMILPRQRLHAATAGYALGNWCERAHSTGRCTLVSSPGALGTYPWIDRDSGMYGIFVMRYRHSKVAERLAAARAAAIRGGAHAGVGSVPDSEDLLIEAPGVSMRRGRCQSECTGKAAAHDQAHNGTKCPQWVDAVEKVGLEVAAWV